MKIKVPIVLLAYSPDTAYYAAPEVTGNLRLFATQSIVPPVPLGGSFAPLRNILEVSV